MSEPPDHSHPDSNSLDQAALFRIMLRSCTRIAVFACDRDLRLLYCNEAAGRLYAFDHEQCGQPAMDEVLGVRPEDMVTIRTVCETSAVRGYAELTIRPAGNRSISVLMTIMPLIDDAGHHIGYLVFGMDVSARRRTEEMLLHYQRAVEASSNLIAAIDRDRVFVLANRAFLASTDLRREQVIGRTVDDVFVNPDARTTIGESIERCLDGEDVMYEQTVTGADDAVRSFQVRYYPLTGSHADITGVVMVSQEITARKQAEQQVRDALVEKEALIASLTAALDEVKTLRGFIPICAHCKKIRDDQGYWGQIEDYISAHSEAEFSHGICPECMEKYFPDYHQSEQAGDEAVEERRE